MICCGNGTLHAALVDYFVGTASASLKVSLNDDGSMYMQGGGR